MNSLWWTADRIFFFLSFFQLDSGRCQPEYFRTSYPRSYIFKRISAHFLSRFSTISTFISSKVFIRSPCFRVKLDEMAYVHTLQQCYKDKSIMGVLYEHVGFMARSDVSADVTYLATKPILVRLQSSESSHRFGRSMETDWLLSVFPPNLVLFHFSSR